MGTKKNVRDLSETNDGDIGSHLCSAAGGFEARTLLLASAMLLSLKRAARKEVRGPSIMTLALDWAHVSVEAVESDLV